MVGGGSAFWVLCYGLYFWVSRISLDSLSGVVLYLGYLLLIVLLDFLVTGMYISHPLVHRAIMTEYRQGPLVSWHLFGRFVGFIAQSVLINYMWQTSGCIGWIQGDYQRTLSYGNTRLVVHLISEPKPVVYLFQRGGSLIYHQLNAVVSA